MASKGRVVRYERKWHIGSYSFVLGPAAASSSWIPLAYGTDPNSTDEVGGDTPVKFNRVVRLIGAWTTSPGAKLVLATHTYLALGVIRGSQNELNQSSIMSSSASDRSWVWREIYALPTTADAQDVEPSLCKFDWKLRGGRGTNVDRDVELSLVASMIGLTAGEFNVNVIAMLLGEDAD